MFFNLPKQVKTLFLAAVFLPWTNLFDWFDWRALVYLDGLINCSLFILWLDSSLMRPFIVPWFEWYFQSLQVRGKNFLKLGSLYLLSSFLRTIPKLWDKWWAFLRQVVDYQISIFNLDCCWWRWRHDCLCHLEHANLSAYFDVRSLFLVDAWLC